ncbi:hypothetical protein HYU93_04935, partial [Candidatus Daviesbacteria bacterium]|nr:hypothetical protein [Candidatus Daviesbacteria bacterium]
VQGFIKNYGRFLGLNVEKLLAIYRREFSESKHPPRVLETFSNPLDQGKFRLTPAKALGGVILGLVTTFFVYLWFEYRFLVGGPFLEVTQPVNELHTESAAVTVTGRTDPEAKVSINNQEIGVDYQGKFSQEIKLAEDMSTIEISAVSKSGKVTKMERTVFVKK